jgi:excisionase family DNA binding protein
MLTPKEVSEITGLSLNTLAQWRSQKRNINYLKIGRRIKYDRRDVDDYLARCKVSVSTRRQK